MKHFFAASMLMATMVTVKTYAQEAPQQPQQHQQGDREAFFKKIDKDGDGKLSKAEVEAASKDDKRLAKLNENFDTIDSNKDGFIDKDELKAFRKSQPHPKKDGDTK